MGTLAIERSREEILATIGDCPDLTFLRGFGNLGDELIYTGTRELLSQRRYHEIGIDALADARGHTLLVCGGGAFCRPFHWMPRVLAIAELRFERVIVLPSSFDTTDDTVREGLARTRATVFAREHESYRRISALCDARLAHDCAFFFDYAPYRTAGVGTLNAFRTDIEAEREWPLPADNDDISATAATLERWLELIAKHALIRTDRAHVMIAASMLGKEVEFSPSSYFKLEAIVDYALGDLPVRRLVAPDWERERASIAPQQRTPAGRAAFEQVCATAARTPPATVSDRDPSGEPRVGAVIVCHDRPELALSAIHSVLAADVAVRVLAIDNNSDAHTRRILDEALSAHASVELHRLDFNAGCSGARQRAVDLLPSELLLFLDDDAELVPGALAQLIGELDAHPESGAVGACTLLEDGQVERSGGWVHESRDVIDFSPVVVEARYDDPSVADSGQCDWLSGEAMLVRRSLLVRFPLDGDLRFGHEAKEWSYRVEKALPGSLRRSRWAMAIHHVAEPLASRGYFGAYSATAERLASAARFHQIYGRLLGPDVFDLMPELVGSDGSRDFDAAHLLMELIVARGSDWIVAEWLRGGLAPLLAEGKPDPPGAAVDPDQAAQLQRLLARDQTLARIENGGWWRLRSRLLPLLRIASRLRTAPPHANPPL